MEVKQIFPEKGNMGRVLPEYLSGWTTGKVRVEGVEVIPNSVVQAAAVDGDQGVLSLQDGSKVST